MPQGSERLSKTAFLEQTYAELDRPFWPAAIDILQEHTTQTLCHRVMQVAEAAPHVDHNGIADTISIIREAYDGKMRKFTNEEEVNHAFQVALLTAQAVNWRELHHDTMVIALLHDLDENTANTAGQITKMTSPRIYSGIDALSHKTNGKDIYPGEDDKTPYFRDLIAAHKKDPELQIATIKSVDQLAVANGPLTASELAHPSLIDRWERMTKKKLKEMELFRSIIPPKDPVASRIDNHIAFTSMRLDPHVGSQLDKTLRAKRTRQIRV